MGFQEMKFWARRCCTVLRYHMDLNVATSVTEKHTVTIVKACYLLMTSHGVTAQHDDNIFTAVRTSNV
jgi:hypothetical protein